MDGFNLQELMSQAKQQYETLQKKMQETVVEGSSGGGTVTVKMDGRKQVLAIKIDPEAVKAGDLEMLHATIKTLQSSTRDIIAIWLTVNHNIAAGCFAIGPRRDRSNAVVTGY